MVFIRKASLAIALLCVFNPAEARSATKNDNWLISGSLRSREELWDWFGTGTGRGHYSFNGSLLRLGATHSTPSDDLTIELEEPFLLGLPSNATLPAPKGQLGMGASYFDASGNLETSLFLKQAFWKIKKPKSPSTFLRLGRFEFIDGTEVIPSDPTLAWLKRERIAHRLIGNFGFTHIGRSLDAIQYSAGSAKSNFNLLFGKPTRGVFDIRGMDEVDGVSIAYGALTMPFNHKHSPGDLRLLAAYYDDSRQGAVKADNRPLAARTADKQGIRISTLGGHYLRTADVSCGKLDGLLWGAWQTGQWGSQDHDAYAFAAEAGFQPRGLPWQPWIRAGYFEASGDANPADNKHGSFFPLLPTPRIYARFPFFTEMNLKDAFVQLILRPTKKLTARLDCHRLALADSHDLWYSGGGAFQEKPNFGYAGRPSGGYGSLANLIDVSLDYQFDRRTTVSLYGAFADGGNVIRNIYPGSQAAYGYAEVLYKW